jgi:hypothetical protein
MKKTAVELIQKLKDKAFQTENDKKLIESFEIERLKQLNNKNNDRGKIDCNYFLFNSAQMPVVFRR